VSKAFALPGIRIGYAVAVRETIARLERLRPPGSVSTISATIGAAALRSPSVAAENVHRLVADEGVRVIAFQEVSGAGVSKPVLGRHADKFEGGAA